MKEAGITIKATGSVRDTYTLDSGRCIVKNGTPLATLHGVGQYDPCELDTLAHVIVNKLNEGAFDTTSAYPKDSA